MHALVIGDDRSLTNEINEALQANDFAAGDLRTCSNAEATAILRHGGIGKEQDRDENTYRRSP